MGIRNVFEAPYYDMSKPEIYEGLNLFTKPIYIISNRLSGYTFQVGADYSQIELKVLAWYALENKMIETLVGGGDLHSVVAKDVFHLDCPVEKVKELYKPHRYRAKKVNFGIVYGMTEYGLSADPKMGMTLREAAAFIKNYLDTYPGVRQYAHDMIAFAREHGYVETMFGHRRPIPDINHPSKFIKQSAENQAMNTPIQGSAADIIRQAMVALQREALIRAQFIRQTMQIHDELVTEVPVERAAEAAWIIKEVMERPIPGFSDIMPIIAEPSVGKIWGHALDINWEKGGTNPYVKTKAVKKEATDITLAEIEYALPLYKMAGIEVRNQILGPDGQPIGYEPVKIA